MGSGYENTVITGNFNPMVKVTSGLGKIQWFLITSLNGVGVNVSAGIISNCVIMGCNGNGIQNNTGGTTASVFNCIAYQNAGYGIIASNGGIINVTNCISRSNGSTGFYGYGSYQVYLINISYSCGSRNSTAGNQGCIDVEPGFIAPDFHIAEGSPCWNTGNPSLLDPDGSRSNMGYFGGPDCPIYPTVVEILIEPNGNNINLKAKARANY